jgi:hypothetical protein
MSLLNNRAIISHLIIMKALHDIQVTTSIRCAILSSKCIPQLLPVSVLHICINQTLNKNTKNCSRKETTSAIEMKRTTMAAGSRDLFSRSQMHVGDQDEENHDGGTVVSRGKT